MQLRQSKCTTYDDVAFNLPIVALLCPATTDTPHFHKGGRFEIEILPPRAQARKRQWSACQPLRRDDGFFFIRRKRSMRSDSHSGIGTIRCISPSTYDFTSNCSARKYTRFAASS